MSGASGDGSRGDYGRCDAGEGAGGPRLRETGADGRGRGSGGGLASRGLVFRPRVGSRRRGRGLGPPGPGAPQPRLHPGHHQRPLCVPTPAPEAPQPAALSSLIGSADGFIDWLQSHPAWRASSRYYWSSELPVSCPREVIARLLGVPGSSSGKPRVLPGSRLRLWGGRGGARAISSRFQSASR